MYSREITYGQAIREAFDQVMENDPKTVLFGLDVDDPKAIVGTTKGLVEKYGHDRVFGTPLSEDALTGSAIGMALSGLRPILNHIRADFMLLGMNQLVNMAAKMHYMFGGQFRVPMVIRGMIGKSWGQGAQHSQSLLSLFAHIPGLVVVAPTTPFDAKGCMVSACLFDGPVVYIDHRMLHYQVGEVGEDFYGCTIGHGRVTRKGTDITIVGISFMQVECLRAAEHLEKLGIKVQVVDPIWLRPLDISLILDSVDYTDGKVLIVDNDWVECGIGSEIAVSIVEFGEKGPYKIKRMGFAPTPCPPSPTLEDEFYPNEKTIALSALRLLRADTESNVSKLVGFPNEDKNEQVFKGPF